MSPLVDFVGRASIVPSHRDEPAFEALAEGCRVSGDRVRQRPGAGDANAARGRTELELAVRIGRAGRGPRSRVPRPGAATPSGRRTTIPPLGSWIAMSGGVPRRPASAVTTPATLTIEPIGCRRATPIDIAAGDAEGGGVVVGRGVALGVGAGVWEGPGLGVGVGVGDGPGDSLGLGVGVGVGGWLGVGAGLALNSPLDVAWSRYPAAPVPLLSRWPSGPMAVTTSPVPTWAPASAAGATTIRSGPLPSSIVTPRPSASSDGAEVTTPVTASRTPSSGSTAAPVLGFDWRGTGDGPRSTTDVPSDVECSKAEVAPDRAGQLNRGPGLERHGVPGRRPAGPRCRRSRPGRTRSAPDSMAPSAVVSVPRTVTTDPSGEAPCGRDRQMAQRRAWDRAWESVSGPGWVSASASGSVWESGPGWAWESASDRRRRRGCRGDGRGRRRSRRRRGSA